MSERIQADNRKVIKKGISHLRSGAREGKAEACRIYAEFELQGSKNLRRRLWKN